ncbi:MAG: hypothetical protein ACRD40_18565 [Candidatus Acidiferrales bacterium]
MRKAAVTITDASGSKLDQYSEDGPELSGWGSVVARYPDGTPAVAQGVVGSGWGVLSGVHPEAPENWRRGMNFFTSVDVDNRYAATLIQAALNRTPLAHYKEQSMIGMGFGIIARETGIVAGGRQAGDIASLGMAARRCFSELEFVSTNNMRRRLL